MSRIAVGVGILYVCALALAVGYGAIRFKEFYPPPAFTRAAAPAADEDSLVAAWEHALAGDYGQYRSFTAIAGSALAVWLGAAAALVGLWRGSLVQGAAAFGAGVVLTVAAFELLPAMWFPFDRYAVGFIWLLTCGPIAAGAWLLTTGAVWFGARRPVST